MKTYDYKNYFDESYFTVGGDRGWYDKTAFALENEWHKRFAEYVQTILQIKEGRVLDVGCARGNVVYWLTKMGLDAYGVDVSVWAVENGWVPDKMKQTSITDGVPFDKGFFDFVISRETLEHISETDIVKVIKNIATMLKKNGLLMIEVATNKGGKEDKKKENPLNQDPSHVLIRDLVWWRSIFEDSELFTVDHERTFKAMNSGLGYKYGWDVLIMVRL